MLLHGLFDSSAGWTDTVQTLKRPCFAVDLPGFGNSSMPCQNSISSYAQDITAALDHLGVTEFDLVGHSLGGGVAAALAEQRSRQVRSLTMLAPVGFGYIALAELARLPLSGALLRTTLRLALAQPLVTKAVFAAFVTNGHGPAAKMTHDLKAHAGALSAGGVCAVHAICDACDSRDAFHHRALDYDGPVRALWGDKDLLVPASHRRALERSLPQAQVSVWPDMGHYPQFERTSELASYLTSGTSATRTPARTRRRIRAAVPAAA